MYSSKNPLITCDSCGLDSSGLERVRFFPRQLITADDFLTEQQYFRQKQRRHNRFLHGWGTVCGLEVKAAPLDDVPWRVSISPGYALSPQGDEIYVPKPFCLDLAKCGLAMVPDICEPHIVHAKPVAIDNTIFVAIKYVECPTRPVRVHPLGCGCDDTACEYSRIRDSFDMSCLPELPSSHQSQIPNLCGYRSDLELMPCLPCPEEPWIVLAKVSLPESSGTEIADVNIDNITSRRQLYSTAVLQEQLISCCCKTAKLTINKSIDIGDVTSIGQLWDPDFPENYIKYKITITNEGPVAAQNILVEDTCELFGNLSITMSTQTDMGWSTDAKFPIGPTSSPAGDVVPPQLKATYLIEVIESQESIELSYQIKIAPVGALAAIVFDSLTNTGVLKGSQIDTSSKFKAFTRLDNQLKTVSE